MKKLSIAGLLLLFLVISSEAQNVYSVQNLEQASMEDLQLYLGKAQRVKKTGAILSIAGPASALTGIALLSGGEKNFPPGFAMLLAGTGVTLVGIPILATGAVRVNKVNRAIDNRQAVRLILSPGSLYNYREGAPVPGLSICMKF